MSTLRVNNVSDLGLDAVVTNGVVEKGALPSGSVLQVVQFQTTTVTTTTSLSFQNTSLTGSITPISASNKILVIAHFERITGNSAAGSSAIGLFRGTVSGTALPAVTDTYTDPSSYRQIPGILTYVDSPASASAVTYTVGLKTSAVANTITVGGYQTLILMEIAG